MANDHNKVIMHLDIDAFYAQVEEMLNPELKNKPIGIYQKTIIVTSNYVAREYGIKKCMLTPEALKLCPNMILINGENLEKYREISQNITQFIQNEYKVEVEKLGFDENFVDITKLVEDRICNISESNICHIDIGKIVAPNHKSDSDDEDFSLDTNHLHINIQNEHYNESQSSKVSISYKRKSSESNDNNSKKSKIDSFKTQDNISPFTLDNSLEENKTSEDIKSKNQITKEFSNHYNNVVGHIYKNIHGKCHCNCIKKLAIGTHISNEIRTNIFNKFKLTLSGGISYNKLLSKLVGSLHKPNQQTVIFPNAVLDLMNNIQLRQIPGIGYKMYEKLSNIGIQTVEQLQNINKSTLIQHFDHSTSEWLINISYGKDFSLIKNFKKQNTIGVEDRYHKPIQNIEEFKKQMKILFNRLLLLIKKDGRLPKLLKIQLRFNHFKYGFKFDSKQCSINPNIFKQDNDKIMNYLIDMSVKLYKELSVKKNSQIVTYINIAFGNFIEINENNILKFCEKKNFITTTQTNTQTTNSTEINHSDKCNVEKLNKTIEIWKNLTQPDQANIDPNVIKNQINKTKNISNEFNNQYKITNLFQNNSSSSKDLCIDDTKKTHETLKSTTNTQINNLNTIIHRHDTPSCSNRSSTSDHNVKANNIKNTDHIISNTSNIDLEILKELPDDIRKEIEADMNKNSYKTNDKSNTNIIPTKSNEECQEDGTNLVNEDILNELPEDIRKEIEADLKLKKIQNQFRTNDNTKKSIKQLSILNFVQKK